MATYFSDEQVLWFDVWYKVEMNCRCNYISKQYQSLSAIHRQYVTDLYMSILSSGFTTYQ